MQNLGSLIATGGNSDFYHPARKLNGQHSLNKDKQKKNMNRKHLIHQRIKCPGFP